MSVYQSVQFDLLTLNFTASLRSPKGLVFQDESHEMSNQIFLENGKKKHVQLPRRRLLLDALRIKLDVHIVDPDQLASSEASRSGSTMFSKDYIWNQQDKS